MRLSGPVQGQKYKKAPKGAFLLTVEKSRESAFQRQSGRLDPAHFVADEYHHKQQHRKADAEGECCGHVVLARCDFAIFIGI